MSLPAGDWRGGGRRSPGKVESAQRGLTFTRRVTKLLDRVSRLEADDGAVLGVCRWAWSDSKRCFPSAPEQAQSSALRAMEVSGKAC